MGWCSGTEIFDKVADFVLHSVFAGNEATRQYTLEVLVSALEDHDWDCQDDSQFIEHPIVKKVMRQLHPDWFKDVTIDGDDQL